MTKASAENQTSCVDKHPPTEWILLSLVKHLSQEMQVGLQFGLCWGCGTREW